MATKHEKSQHPNHSPLSQTRRSALKKILVGTGVAAGAAALPDKWAKPIVDNVLVPAHAQTSPSCNGSGSVTIRESNPAFPIPAGVTSISIVAIGGGGGGGGGGRAGAPGCRPTFTINCGDTSGEGGVGSSGTEIQQLDIPVNGGVDTLTIVIGLGGDPGTTTSGNTNAGKGVPGTGGPGDPNGADGGPVPNASRTDDFDPPPDLNIRAPGGGGGGAGGTTTVVGPGVTISAAGGTGGGGGGGAWARNNRANAQDGSDGQNGGGGGDGRGSRGGDGGNGGSGASNPQGAGAGAGGNGGFGYYSRPTRLGGNGSNGSAGENGRVTVYFCGQPF